jgi:serine/threonine protein kinase
VLHQIGAGTLGPVFRAYDSENDRLVAIKLFRLDLPPERVHQLVGEFEQLIAAQLTHAGIAAPIATGMTENSAYLVQEFAAADSLDVVVRDHGPAPAGNALRVAVQLAGALDFAGVVNIDHGALHPRDVLISTDETRMTGLGVVRALERVGVAAPLRRPYSAPERIAGGPWDRRADVFSLAALVHELMWGRRISGVGAQGVVVSEIAGADLSALRDAFGRALAEDPADRFETALEFAAAVKSAFPATVDVRPPERSRARVEHEPRLPLDPEPLPEPEPELRPVEPARYQEIDEPPAEDVHVVEPTVLIHEPVMRDEEPPMRPSREIEADLEPPMAVQPPGFLTAPEPDAISALERSRSAMWPIVLAFLVGGALVFPVAYGIGYGIGSDRAPAPAVAPIASTAQAPSPAPAGRDFTDAAIPEQPSPTPAPVAPPAPSQPPSLGRSAQSSGAPSQSSAPEVGRLSVKTTPVGARVFIDGRDRGRTPASIKDLARGAHRVRLVREGYATEERRVLLNAAHPEQAIAVELTRTRPAAPTATRGVATSFAGSLSVDSRPIGAKVFVDGKLVGSTPFVMPEVGAGEHAIRIEHDGYQRWSSSVRVVSGERARVTASLEK